jgi:hypothetical protein
MFHKITKVVDNNTKEVDNNTSHVKHHSHITLQEHRSEWNWSIEQSNK